MLKIPSSEFQMVLLIFGYMGDSWKDPAPQNRERRRRRGEEEKHL